MSPGLSIGGTTSMRDPPSPRVLWVCRIGSSCSSPCVSLARTPAVSSASTTTMSSLQTALEELVQLLKRTPKEVIQENGLLVKEVCRKLKKGLSTPSSSLLEALESDKIKKKIEKYIQRSPEHAVIRTVELADLDFRLLDIQHVDAHSDDQTKFRKGLGERSLGEQYHKWEMREFKRSKLDDLCKDPGVGNTGEGNIVEFIKANGLPEESYVQKAIRNGTRLLLLDHLFGAAGASAVVSFAPSRFRDVTGPDLQGLADSMRQNAWITGLMPMLKPWIEGCWAVYDGQQSETILGAFLSTDIHSPDQTTEA
jgi:hypothetical protein